MHALRKVAPEKIKTEKAWLTSRDLALSKVF